ncbi:hypothetical protein AHAS_Ahas15G0284100 [Arachis hypogaea]
MLINQGIKLDLITYNLLINGLCKIYDLKEDRKLVNEMSERGLKSNKITFIILIDEYCKDKDIKIRRRSKELRLSPTKANKCSKYNGLLKFRDICPTSCRAGNLYPTCGYPIRTNPFG